MTADNKKSPPSFATAGVLSFGVQQVCGSYATQGLLGLMDRKGAQDAIRK